ncbi:hypothetical protein SAMD00023353_5400360 [Rosellinia necatrix]|uniref:DIX domain-containing protein n=1 Tax=Rosellinia necatrix TaxID=77044 RepID=A0A1W2TRA1_ROSNE|nr:hypothetical protein SAMD00023353_5400360 [Rosellinia necatrix]
MYLSSILASRGPSQLGIPTYHNIVDPEAVEVEDSDDDGPERNAQTSNTSTLGSFKTKLIRRLSHRVDTKAGSRPSIGTSDEELARRAELKRLMHKRIQEELKSEEEEEDDLRLTSLRQPNIGNCVEPELPRGGPRDTIEFSVSGIEEKEAKKNVGTPLVASNSLVPVADGPRGPFQRRTGHSEPVKGSMDSSYQDCNRFPDNMGSIIQPPLPAHLTPIHLSLGNDRESPSTASWRLSYSTIHIESYIEPLVETRHVSCPQSPEPENSFPSTTHALEADITADRSNPTAQDETNDTSQTMETNQVIYPELNYKENNISSQSVETSDGRCSPLDVWLRSQDLLAAPILTSCRGGETVSDHGENNVREKSDSPRKPESPVRLSGRNDQSTNSCSSSQEYASGAWPQPPKRLVGQGNPLIVAPSNESIALRRILGQMENVFTPEGPPTEDQTQDVSSWYTSSRYTTRPNSQRTTPRGSRLSLLEFLGGRRTLQPPAPAYGPISPYRMTTTDDSGISSYYTAPNTKPLPDRGNYKAEVSQSPISETISINASETASFRQREEELKSIEKRFGLTPARRYLTAPVISKFREEFEGPRLSSSRRSSILSKLHLTLPKRGRPSELNKSIEDIRKLQTPNETLLTDSDSNRNQCRPFNVTSNTQTREGAIGFWQRNIKKELDQTPGTLKAKLIKVSMPKININGVEMGSISMKNRHPVVTRTHSIDKARKVITKNLFSPSRAPNNITIIKEPAVHESADIHTGVLQEWVEQLQAEDAQRQSRTYSRINIPKRQPPRLCTPPESWAKWPSHTRKERVASAGGKDKVNSWDFAVTINPNVSGAKAVGKALSKGIEPAIAPRTLSGQVSKALKSGWNRMVTRTSSLGRPLDCHEPASKSHKPRGFLEYPELELLPTAEGYREVQALDQQIGTMKRRSISTRRVSQRSSNESTRPAMATRIAEEVHKFQVEDENVSWADVGYSTKAPSITQFLSPAHALLTRRSKSCDPELFSASESISSYDDCVQIQMLEDIENKVAQDSGRAMIKRAKSTGNIGATLPGTIVPAGEDTLTARHKARKLGLRRHGSLGWIRGRDHKLVAAK